MLAAAPVDAAGGAVSLPMSAAEPDSANHRLPSGPATMSCGSPLAPANSVIVPSVATRPTSPAAVWSVNHSAPSGPVVMRHGLVLVSPAEYLVIIPPVVIFPIAAGEPLS